MKGKMVRHKSYYYHSLKQHNLICWNYFMTIQNPVNEHFSFNSLIESIWEAKLGKQENRKLSFAGLFLKCPWCLSWSLQPNLALHSRLKGTQLLKLPLLPNTVCIRRNLDSEAGHEDWTHTQFSSCFSNGKSSLVNTETYKILIVENVGKNISFVERKTRFFTKATGFIPIAGSFSKIFLLYYTFLTLLYSFISRESKF